MPASKALLRRGRTTEEEASKWWDQAAARDERGGFYASGCAAILLITVCIVRASECVHRLLSELLLRRFLQTTNAPRQE